MTKHDTFIRCLSNLRVFQLRSVLKSLNTIIGTEKQNKEDTEYMKEQIALIVEELDKRGE